MGADVAVVEWFGLWAGCVGLDYRRDVQVWMCMEGDEEYCSCWV